MKIKNTPMII